MRLVDSEHQPASTHREEGRDTLPPDAVGLLLCGVTIGFLLGMLVVWVSFAARADESRFQIERNRAEAQYAAAVDTRVLLRTEQRQLQIEEQELEMLKRELQAARLQH